MIKIGVVGYGYWGPNLVRNFFVKDSCIIKTVADSKRERLDLVHKNYPAFETTTEAEKIFKDPDIDAVVVSTPVLTHYSLAKKALQEGKHVLIEKPMTTSFEKASELVKLARKQKKCLWLIIHSYIPMQSKRSKKL